MTRVSKRTMIKIRKTRSWWAIKAKYLAQGNNAIPPVGLCSHIFNGRQSKMHLVYIINLTC